VFESLTERLDQALKKLTGRGKLSEADVDAGLREVRLALLEADVNYKVVKDFVASIRARAVGTEVMDSLNPGQQLVKIVDEEMIRLLGDRVPMTYAPFWLWMPLIGFAPWMVLLAQAWSLIYQFWIHTERIGKLWRPIEFIFNTPSHHRVHHGMDQQYLDRNYGGILILWDRLFGSFCAENTRPHYGLTKQVDTFNIWKLQTGEYVAIARDVRHARRWRDRLGYILGPPGWAPAEPKLAVDESAKVRT